MGHKVSTLCNGKAIYAMIGEILSLEDWASVSQQIMANISATTDNVHVIVDMRKTKTHPMNALDIKRVTIWANERQVKTINHVTENRITSILGEVVIGLVAHTYQSMKTPEDAFQRILQADSSITESMEELVQEIV